ncbi:hypothetical protein ANAEL_04146 [Anaerolineales bacterium]|nr:hypothetical protein ANAEL_04146 [Anaerolineales bacterium]
MVCWQQTTVSLNDTDYQRLLEAERQLQTVQNNLPDVLAGIRQQSSTELQNRLFPLEQRQQQFQREMAQTTAAMQSLEQQTAAEFARTNVAMQSLEQQTVERLARQRQETLQRLVAQEQRTADQLAQQDRDLRTALQQTAGNLRAETRRLLQEQDQRLGTLIRQEGEERRAQVASLQEQITNIVDVQLRQKQVAQVLIERAEAQRAFIDREYRHGRFAPGRLNELGRVLEQAKENQGLAPQAALVKAQDAYNGLSDLRLELERLEREWEVWRSAALESARSVLEMAQRNRQCKAIGRNGKPADLAIEVDWWTQGKLSRLEQEAQGVVNELSGKNAALKTEELQQIVEKKAPELRKRVEDTIQEARLAVVSSQIRSNIADLAVQALEARGFAVEDGTYEGEDMRNGFAAKVKDLSGTEVVVHITPVEGDPTRNELSIHNFDREHREPHEIEQRAKEITEILRAKGLEAGETHGSTQHANEALRDFQPLRGQKPHIERTTRS